MKFSEVSDWVRLCFADAAGSKGRWPYLIHDGDWGSFRKEHVFDWFRQDGTRQLFAGFNHTIACSSGNYAENVLVHHFRRHYFNMALLAVFEFAALLSFSSRISHAVEHLRTRHDEDAFREELLNIRRNFLHFVHEFRFTGVSNQMQPRVMYDMWRKHLGLHELFHDVEDELRVGSDYLLAMESREQTETGNRLNIIAAFGVTLGAILGFTATDGFTIIQSTLFKEGKEWFATFGILSFVVSGLAYLASFFLLESTVRHTRLVRRMFIAMMIASILVAMAGWCIP